MNGGGEIQNKSKYVREEREHLGRRDRSNGSISPRHHIGKMIERREKSPNLRTKWASKFMPHGRETGEDYTGVQKVSGGQGDHGRCSTKTTREGFTLRGLWQRKLSKKDTITGPRASRGGGEKKKMGFWGLYSQGVELRKSFWGVASVEGGERVLGLRSTDRWWGNSHPVKVLRMCISGIF